MKWFKHECTAHNDEKMRELIHELGPEGYGILMICYELIGEKIDEKKDPRIEITWRVLTEKTRTRLDKLKKILKTSAFQSLLVSNFRGISVELFCPSMLNRLDNWTERQKNYRVTTEQLTANKNKKEKKEEEVEANRPTASPFKPKKQEQKKCPACEKFFPSDSYMGHYVACKEAYDKAHTFPQVAA